MSVTIKVNIFTDIPNCASIGSGSELLILMFLVLTGLVIQECHIGLVDYWAVLLVHGIDLTKYKCNTRKLLRLRSNNNIPVAFSYHYFTQYTVQIRMLCVYTKCTMIALSTKSTAVVYV